MTKSSFLIFIISFCFGTSATAQTWEVITNVTNKNLNSVHFPSEQVGYAVGDDGTLLKTTDGGSLWTNLSNNLNISKDIHSLFFTSENIGFIVGYETFYRTIDGGATWIKVTDGIGDCIFTSVHFISPQIGFATASLWTGKGIYKTTNGGITWSKKTIPDTGDRLLRSIHFVNNSVGYAVGHGSNSGGVVLRTENGGETWVEQNFANTGIDISSVLILPSVYFVNEQLGFIVGSDYWANGVYYNVIFKTTDGGQSWESNLYVTNQHVSNVYFVNEHIGYIAGEFAGILKTTDSGENWSKVQIPGYSWANSLWFRNEDNGVIVGYGGKIAIASPSDKTGLEESSSLSIKIYPNPIINNFFIESQSTINVIKIYNQLGSLVFEKNDFNSEKVQLDLSGFKSGLYVIEINDWKQTIIKK